MHPTPAMRSPAVTQRCGTPCQEPNRFPGISDRRVRHGRSASRPQNDARDLEKASSSRSTTSPSRPWGRCSRGTGCPALDRPDAMDSVSGSVAVELVGPGVSMRPRGRCLVSRHPEGRRAAMPASSGARQTPSRPLLPNLERPAAACCGHAPPSAPAKPTCRPRAPVGLG